MSASGLSMSCLRVVVLMSPDSLALTRRPLAELAIGDEGPPAARDHWRRALSRRRESWCLPSKARP
eukprot:2974529-Pyramimonas_sp.AAC.1